VLDAHDLGFIDARYFPKHDLECLSRNHVKICRLPNAGSVTVSGTSAT
jgi:hypothetical protein